MGKSVLRMDKICLNCSSIVENKFCSDCGQENTESHQSFRQLTYHFIEDLTHYDNAFWKTIKYLLFFPTKLTEKYLSGKRKQFVPPIKLYFFISFITFFLPAILPEVEDNNSVEKNDMAKTEETKSIKDDSSISILGLNINNVKQLDSLQNALPEKERIGTFSYLIFKTKLKLTENKNSKSEEEIDNDINESMLHNLSKAIFIYLPVFGFLLWLFHSKKRWFFFDHAIFTLHFFAFLLLSLTISITLFGTIIQFIPNETIRDLISNLSLIITSSWIIIYFFIAHKRMYGESKLISFTKSAILLVINIFFISTIIFSLALYTLFNLH
jgi:hypothetical protein